MPTPQEIKDPNLIYCHKYDVHCRCPKCEVKNLCGYQENFCDKWCQLRDESVKEDGVIYCFVLDGPRELKRPQEPLTEKEKKLVKDILGVEEAYNEAFEALKKFKKTIENK